MIKRQYRAISIRSSGGIFRPYRFYIFGLLVSALRPRPILDGQKESNPLGLITLQKKLFVRYSGQDQGSIS